MDNQKEGWTHRFASEQEFQKFLKWQQTPTPVALRELNEEQMICLRNALIERTPKLQSSKNTPVEYAEGEDDIAFDFHQANEKVSSKDVEAANFMQEVPNSHRWTDFKMLLNWVEQCMSHGKDRDFLIIGLKNSIQWAEQAKEGDKPVG